MNPVERVEILEMREEMRSQFHDLREDMARGFRDLTRREEDTRDRVARMEGGIAMVRWLGPGGVAALIIGLLIQSGLLR